MIYVWVKSEGGGGKGGGLSFLDPPSKNYSALLQNFKYISGILSPSTVDWHPLGHNGLRGGPVDMSKSQRHTRSGARHGVSQANEAAIYPKLTELRQHEIVSGILKNWKQCGTMQASYGCLVGHVCMGVRTSIFAP